MASGNPDIGAVALASNPSEAEVVWEENPITFESPWSQKSQVLRRFGRWRLRYTWDRRTRTQADAIYPVFAQRGAGESFTVYRLERPEPTGSATVAQLASLKVNGGSQTGRSLIVDGGPNSTLIFRAGDMIGLGTGQALEVAANCTTNGSGAATVTLCQYLGASPADNSDVIVSYVPIRVRLDRMPVRRITPPELYTWTVEMTEAFA